LVSVPPALPRGGRTRGRVVRGSNKTPERRHGRGHTEGHEDDAAGLVGPTIGGESQVPFPGESPASGRTGSPDLLANRGRSEP
jgi:hypothetical protein